MEHQELSLFLKPQTLKPQAQQGGEITRKFSMNAVGRMLAAAMQDRSIRLYDARTCDEVQRMQDDYLCTSLAFSPRGDIVASGGVDRIVKLWDIRAGECIAKFEGHTYPILSLDFSPDGDRLVSASGDTSLAIWDVDNKSKLHDMKGHALYVVSCAWDPNSDRIVSGGVDAVTNLWNAQTGKLLESYEEHRTSVNDVKFNKDGSCLATASSDSIIILWDTEGYGIKVDKKLHGHSDDVRCIAFSTDSKYLASGSTDKDLFIWSLEEGSIQGEALTLAEIDGIEWYPEEHAFLTADGTGTIVRWEVSDLSSLLGPFQELLDEIKADSDLTRKSEFIEKFENLQQQYDDEVLRDKRLFYIIWQCKKELGLLKGKVRQT